MDGFLMKYKITIEIDNQKPFDWGGDIGNIKADLHGAIEIYMKDYYVKEKEKHIFDKLQNHYCKNCQEGTITEIYTITGQGVKIKCTKCGNEDWL